MSQPPVGESSASWGWGSPPPPVAVARLESVPQIAGEHSVAAVVAPKFETVARVAKGPPPTAKAKAPTRAAQLPVLTWPRELDPQLLVTFADRIAKASPESLPRWQHGMRRS